MANLGQLWQIAAGLFGLSGVVLGAIAAHALSDPHAAASVERAALYQIVHALALLLIASRPGTVAGLAGLAFTLGVLLFCGGIYLKYLAEQSWAGPITPIGGMALMAGWLLTVFARVPGTAQ